MGITMNSNIPALNAGNCISKNEKEISKSMQKLSSGFKINASRDDSSGLAISEKMRNQITALDTVSDDCEDGVNLLQTADGNLAQMQDIISRMVEITAKSTNGVLDDDDRIALQDEMYELGAELDRISTTANFNGHKLFCGEDQKRTLEYIQSRKLTDIHIDISDDQVMMGKSPVSTVREIVDAIKNTTTDIVPNIGKTVSRTEVHEEYLNNSLKKSKQISLPVDPAEQCPELRNYKAYYDFTIDPSIVMVAESQPPEYDPATWTQVSIGYTYSSRTEKTILDEREIVNTLDIKVGEDAVAANELTFLRPDLHTNRMFNTQSAAGTETVTIPPSSGNTGAAGGLNSASEYSTGSSGGTYTHTIYSNDYIKNPVSTFKNGIVYDISTQEKALRVLDKIRDISEVLSEYRGEIGAIQNRVEYTIVSTNKTSENITAALSRIRDTDMAEEMTGFTKSNIISQTSQAMLAQANTNVQDVLGLLK